MSKVSIEGNASGTGTLTIAAPNTNSNYTLTLPSETGTILTSGGAIDVNASAPADSLTIDSSGNVGIGTTSPTSKLDINGGSAATTLTVQTSGALYSANIDLKSSSTTTIKNANGVVSISNGDAAGQLRYNMGGTERARIDSSGNLLVGATAQVWDERLLVRSDTNTVKLGLYGNATSFTSSVIRAQVETAAGTGWYFFEGRASGGGFQYGIRGNGTVATSDERRKKNIEPARSYLQDICNIPIVKYNWKTDEEGTPKELGWLAQDVQKVFPNMVVTHYDGPNDDQEVLLLKKEVFVPMLMQCIQELKAELDEAKARIATLEAGA